MCFNIACWGAIDWRWGTTYVCLGKTFICFVPRWFSVIRIGPKCQHKKISMPKCYLKTNQIHENPCRVRPWMEIEWQALIKRETACTRGVLYWASLFDAPRGVINSNIRGLLGDDWTMQWGWKSVFWRSCKLLSISTLRTGLSENTRYAFITSILQSLLKC